MLSINIQVDLKFLTYICVNYMHIYVSTSFHHWTFIFYTTSGMHRPPIKGRHLVYHICSDAKLVRNMFIDCIITQYQT